MWDNPTTRATLDAAATQIFASGWLYLPKDWQILESNGVAALFSMTRTLKPVKLRQLSATIFPTIDSATLEDIVRSVHAHLKNGKLFSRLAAAVVARAVTVRCSDRF